MLSMNHLVQEAFPGRRVRGRSSLRAEEARRLSLAIDALPETSRLALALRYYEGMRPARIARVLGLTEDEVESLLAAAVREVAGILRDGEPPEPLEPPPVAAPAPRRARRPRGGDAA